MSQGCSTERPYITSRARNVSVFGKPKPYVPLYEYYYIIDQKSHSSRAIDWRISEFSASVAVPRAVLPWASFNHIGTTQP